MIEIIAGILAIIGSLGAATTVTYKCLELNNQERTDQRVEVINNSCDHRGDLLTEKISKALANHINDEDHELDIRINIHSHTHERE